MEQRVPSLAEQGKQPCRTACHSPNENNGPNCQTACMSPSSTRERNPMPMTPLPRKQPAHGTTPSSSYTGSSHCLLRAGLLTTAGQQLSYTFQALLRLPFDFAFDSGREHPAAPVPAPAVKAARA